MMDRAQSVTALGQNPFEALDSFLNGMATRVHNGRDGYGKSLTAKQFQDIEERFRAARSETSHKTSQQRKDWGSLSLTLCAGRSVRVAHRNYTIPEFIHAKVIRLEQRDGAPHSYIDICRGAMPALLSTTHVQQRIDQRAKDTVLDSTVLRNMGAAALFFSKLGANLPKGFGQDPQPVALASGDGFFAAHLEPVSDAVPSHWFKSSRLIVERVERIGYKKRENYTVDPVKYVTFVNTFLGLPSMSRSGHVVHEALIRAFEHPDIVAALNKLYYSHVCALSDETPLELDPSLVPQHTRERLMRERGTNESVDAFIMRINHADISEAFKRFGEQTAEAAGYLSTRGASLPLDALARAAERKRGAERARKLAILAANGL